MRGGSGQPPCWEGEGFVRGEPLLCGWANSLGGFPPGPAPGLGWEQTCLRCREENGLPHYQDFLPHLKYNAPGRRRTSGCCSPTASWGAPIGLLFPRGTTLQPSPGPLVSEIWAGLGWGGRDPLGLCARAGRGAWGDAGRGPSAGMSAGVPAVLGEGEFEGSVAGKVILDS